MDALGPGACRARKRMCGSGDGRDVRPRRRGRSGPRPKMRRLRPCRSPCAPCAGLGNLCCRCQSVFGHGPPVLGCRGGNHPRHRISLARQRRRISSGQPGRVGACLGCVRRALRSAPRWPYRRIARVWRSTGGAGAAERPGRFCALKAVGAAQREGETTARHAAAGGRGVRPAGCAAVRRAEDRPDRRPARSPSR